MSPSMSVPFTGPRHWILTLFVLVIVSACTTTPGTPTAARSPSPTRSPAPAPSTPFVRPAASPIPPPVTGTVPGQTTPQAVVAAFIDANQAAVVSADYTAACTLVVPSEQAGCPGALAQLSLSAIPPVTIGNDVVMGTLAIVVAVGQTCADFTCVTTTNPSYQLPGNPAEFSAAYQNAINQLGGSSPQFPCKQVGSLWYVDLGANL